MRFLKIAAVLFGLAPLIPPGSAHSLPLSEVRTEARKLSLDAGTRQRFTNAQILAFINEGQRQAVVAAKPIVKSFEFQAAAGTTYYAMPSDFLQVTRVTYDYGILDEATPEALDRSDEWQGVDGEPTHYFLHWATRTYIGLYPYPDSSSTDTVRCEYYAQGTDLSSDTDVPFNGIRELYPYHYALAYFAAGMMASIDGRQDLAQLYFAQYASIVSRMEKEAMARPSYKPGVVSSRSGSGRNPIVP